MTFDRFYGGLRTLVLIGGTTLMGLDWWDLGGKKVHDNLRLFSVEKKHVTENLDAWQTPFVRQDNN